MFSNGSEYWNWKESYCLECAFRFNEDKLKHKCKTEAYLDGGICDPKTTPEIKEINGRIVCIKFRSDEDYKKDQEEAREKAKLIRESKPMKGQVTL